MFTTLGPTCICDTESTSSFLGNLHWLLNRKASENIKEIRENQLSIFIFSKIFDEFYESITHIRLHFKSIMKQEDFKRECWDFRREWNEYWMVSSLLLMFVYLFFEKLSLVTLVFKTELGKMANISLFCIVHLKGTNYVDRK